MKLSHYGHFKIIFAGNTQYEIDGEPGYLNAPWSTTQPNKVYYAKIDNGKITAKIIDAESTFSGKIIKQDELDKDLYHQVDQTIMLESLKKVISAMKYKSDSILMNKDDFNDIKSWTENETK